MEVERERFSAPVTYSTGADGKTKAHIGPEHKVGATEKFEFGMAKDAMTAVVGGGYVSNWNSDFLQRVLGKEGTCARFYFDKKVAVDIGDPEDKVSLKKRKLLFKHGFGYLCIPSGFANDETKLRRLYQSAIEEYFAYEKVHPRPKVFQEAVDIDNSGQARRVMMTAIDIRVGGGLEGSIVQQKAEMKHAAKLTKGELHTMKIRSKLHKKLRRSLQSGTPFRNPFVKKNQRMYPVQYATAS